MRFFRRRPAETPKVAALAEARKATAKMRRANAKAERHRTGRQGNPAHEINFAPGHTGLD